MASERALAALVEYGKALAEKRRLRNERDSHECEAFEPSESDTGYRGVPHCWRSGMEPNDDWCEPCRKRDALHRQMVTANVVMRCAKRRMDYYAPRAAFTCGPQP
jgi:hypothetical protein